MYLPSVRIIPFGPAPYWKIETVPGAVSYWAWSRKRVME